MYILELQREAYQFLLIIFACLVCLAHGSNDVANAISPLLVELKFMGLKKSWAYWMVGISIFLGLLNLGYEVVGILGKTVYTFDFYNGFACQFATANCIILGTRLGIPLSTTHCMVGSIFGIVLANKTKWVKTAYSE